LSVFIDASALVSYFVTDALSDRVTDWFAASNEPICVSRWAVAEFSSALGARRRAGSLTDAEGEQAEAALDQWLEAGVELVDVAPGDFELARRLIRSDRVVAKAADALHVAIAVRFGASLVSLDGQMRRAANALGLAVQPD
jgi:predicted nucleic acid-binding protein